jgi:urea transport system substrate-binding protein
LVEDGASDERVFAKQAEKLLEQDKVDVIFGCWSSGGRKRVAEACVKHDRLLFYPVNYEGLEQSNNIIYLGGSANQSLIPLARWVYTDLGKRRFFIVGSEDIFSHSSVEILQRELTELGARVVGVEYALVGETFNMKAIATAANDAKPDFIINLIDGYQANLALAQALRASGIQPATVPTAWVSISEPELSQFHARDIVGDYTVGCYFESLDLPENKEFISRFRKRFAEFRRINDAMQSAYTGVRLWKKAVEQANTTDTGPVRTALRGMSITGPEGKIKIDAQNLHAWRIARVGQVVADGPLLQFEMKFQSPAPVPPVVFPEWKSPAEWQAFQEKLYQGWGNSWEKHR